jgi:hypothetical protein
MSFAQLAYRESLRETVAVLASSGRQLYHILKSLDFNNKAIVQA